MIKSLKNTATILNDEELRIENRDRELRIENRN
uniref:Uncharacterized protein n=1 Tax=Rhizophora mucronata TaxID=61149 RepID=A0A2P2N9T2_RHIMU